MRYCKPVVNARPVATPVALLTLAHERSCEADLAAAIEASLASNAGCREPEEQRRAVQHRSESALPNVRVELGSLADYDVHAHRTHVSSVVPETAHDRRAPHRRSDLRITELRMPNFKTACV